MTGSVPAKALTAIFSSSSIFLQAIMLVKVEIQRKSEKTGENNTL